jgi:hypothetical protein
MTIKTWLTETVGVQVPIVQGGRIISRFAPATNEHDTLIIMI